MPKDLFYEGQYAEPHYIESHSENLLLYVVLDAIDSARNNDDPLHADEDLYWLFDEPLDEYKSFGWYCNLLRWDASIVRTYLRANWHDTTMFNKQLSRIAMGKIPSYVPRVFAWHDEGDA